jgi:hypothetical protein
MLLTITRVRNRYSIIFLICRGGYVELRRRKWEENGGYCAMRSFIICTLNLIPLE